MILDNYALQKIYNSMKMNHSCAGVDEFRDMISAHLNLTIEEIADRIVENNPTRKIQAIKDLRTEMSIGLKDAKIYIENALYRYHVRLALEHKKIIAERDNGHTTLQHLATKVNPGEYIVIYSTTYQESERLEPQSPFFHSMKRSLDNL